MAFFLVHLLRRGPEWDPAKPLEEQSGWTEPAAFMDDLTDKGFIILGGQLAAQVRVVQAAEAESGDAIGARFATDQWTESHLLVDRAEAWTIPPAGPAAPRARV